MTKTCAKCGQEYSISLQEKAIREAAAALTIFFQKMKDLVKESEGYCSKCWRETLLPEAEKYLEKAKEKAQ